MLAGVVAMHLGIAVMSPGLTEFALAMLAANLAFVSGAWLRGLVTGPTQPALRVLFDGACPRCRASMALITAADPDHVVEPIDLTAVDVQIDPSQLDARGLHAVDACGLETRPDHGRVRRRAVARRVAAALLAAGGDWLPARGSPGRAVVYTMDLRPLGRATFPARTTSAGSILERRELLPRDRGHAQDHHNAIATPADTEEAPHS